MRSALFCIDWLLGVEALDYTYLRAEEAHAMMNGTIRFSSPYQLDSKMKYRK